MSVELLYRGVSAAFFGALTQAFRRAQPAWLAAIAALVLVPLASHSLEFTVHLARGTPKLIASMISSVVFTVLSTLFHLYAMRRGVLIVGSEGRSFAADFRVMPRIVAGFLGGGAHGAMAAIETRFHASRADHSLLMGLASSAAFLLRPMPMMEVCGHGK